MTPLHRILAEQLTMFGPSIPVMLALVILLIATLWMFIVLLQRETVNRSNEALSEWARSAGYRVRSSSKRDTPPEALWVFEPGVQPVVWVTGKRCTLARFTIRRETPAVGEADNKAPTVPPRPPRRNVLIWPVDRVWTPVGLRPVSAADSLVDLLGLPAQLAEGTQRFSVCTNDRKLAHRIAGTSARGLLPPDVGLILAGENLYLDFSGRPFDGIEFNRMIAVAEQVVRSLQEIASV